MRTSDSGLSLAAVCERLEGLRALPENWDSYGAPRISEAALAQARAVVAAASSQFGPAFGERAGPAFVAPVADGGVQLEWETGLAELQVEIGPGGELSYLLIHDPQGERHYEERHGVTLATLLIALN